MSVFLSCLRHYFFIIAIFRSPWTKQKTWLVIWCCRDLLFECVKQQHQGFGLITVLQFWKSRHAFLPFLWGVFWIYSPVLLFSHKMTKESWVLVSFGSFVGIFWEVLISCYIRLFLRNCLLYLCFSSFLCLSFFLSRSTPSTHTSICLRTKAHGRQRREASRVMKKWNVDRARWRKIWEFKVTASSFLDRD